MGALLSVLAFACVRTKCHKIRNSRASTASQSVLLNLRATLATAWGRHSTLLCTLMWCRNMWLQQMWDMLGTRKITFVAFKSCAAVLAWLAAWGGVRGEVLLHCWHQQRGRGKEPGYFDFCGKTIIVQINWTFSPTQEYRENLLKLEAFVMLKYTEVSFLATLHLRIATFTWIIYCRTWPWSLERLPILNSTTLGVTLTSGPSESLPFTMKTGMIIIKSFFSLFKLINYKKFNVALHVLSFFLIFS